MEFKIWGRLDENGRIQTIQSNCSGLNEQFGSLPSVCSDSILTLNEKKKLVYELDSKTDEMSLLILQLSEMSKRVQLQEKLLSEYEDKFNRQQTQIDLLRRENALLRSNCAAENIPELKILPIPAISRQPVTTFEMTCNLKCKPLKHHSCPVMTTDSYSESDVFSSSESDNSRGSCSTCASRQISSDSQTNTLDCVDGITRDDVGSLGKIGEAGLADSTDLHNSVSFDTCISEAVNQTDESKFLEGSADGYVLATSDDKAVNHNNNVPDDIFSHVAYTESDIRQDAKSIDGDSDKKEGILDSRGYVLRPPETLCSAKSCLSIDTDNHGYLILNGTQAPQMREIANEEIHGTWLSVHLKIQQSQNGEETEGFSQRPESNDTRSSFVLNETTVDMVQKSPKPAPRHKHRIRQAHAYAEIDESKLEPVTNTESSSLSVPAEDSTRDEPSSDTHSEADECNACIKAMKTTMEWAKAKKGLLKESNEMTVEKVESLLRDTVKEIYTTLKHYESSKPHRMNKPVPEKAVAVQHHLKHSKVVEIVSDDFLRKCVMVCCKTS